MPKKKTKKVNKTKKVDDHFKVNKEVAYFVVFLIVGLVLVMWVNNYMNQPVDAMYGY